MRRLLVLLLVACAAPAAHADDLKVATWNLNWLTGRLVGDTSLPEGVGARAPEDLARLARYAEILAADVVAIQEVDGPEIAARVFPPDRYALHLTSDAIVQRNGLAIRRGIAFTANPDLDGLDVYPDARFHLRKGADVTLDLQSGKLRVLAVHLKTGCRQEPLDTALAACATLRRQLAVLQGWTAAREAEHAAFLLLGDFSRRMEPPDAFAVRLAAAGPLARATSGRSSPCWGGDTFVDHIIAGGAARAWVRPETLRVMVYRETGEGWRQRLSDHCPVSVRLTLPDHPGDPP